MIYIVYWRIRSPFWTKLPAFQCYKWHYWFMNPQFISKTALLREGHYYNKNVITIPLTQLLETKELKSLNPSSLNTLVLKHINQNYLNYDDVIYTISNNDLHSINRTHSLISYLKTESDEIDASIISYPCLLFSTPSFHMKTEKKYFKNKDFVETNCVDYLCVKQTMRKKRIAPQLIYSHISNADNSSETPFSCIFKNEGFKTPSLVPFVSYTCYIYDGSSIENIQHNIRILSLNNVSCVELNPLNKTELHKVLATLYDTLRNDNYFNTIILPHRDTLINYLNNNIISIFILIDKEGNHKGYYIFKDIHSLVDNKDYEYVCLASVDLTYPIERKLSIDFKYGFKIACFLCKTKFNQLYKPTENTSYSLCCVEEIAHNYLILRDNNMIQKCSYTIPMYYYTYNILLHTHKPERVFIFT